MAARAGETAECDASLRIYRRTGALDFFVGRQRVFPRYCCNLT